MADDLNTRSRNILEAIIEDYIVSGAPVGSRSVSRRPRMALSPATVRNVMSDLEEMGYLCSPHTSAGRIPTEKGYRLYVDSLLQVRSLSREEKLKLASINRFEGYKIEDMLQEASKVLSGISRYTGIVRAPKFSSTVFRQIEFVNLSRGKILVILVGETGLVQNQVIESDENISASELEQIANYLNQALSGLTIQKAKERIFQEMSQEHALYNQLYRRAFKLSGDALREESVDQVFIEGAANILEQPEFADIDRMKRLFRTFEQKSKLLELLDKSQQADGVKIFIGSESQYSDIEGCSLITATYSDRHGALGTLGVIGPSRMPYSMVIPVVDYTARLISQILEAESE